MLHDRMGLEYLADLLLRRGIRHLVVSPGSRNAPIIEAFCKRRNFECKAIVDERSAAFIALGMAQQLGQTVAIACTSGSAVLNFAPAIAEAYYRRIPLLVLTADRPAELIDQGDGQTMRQRDVYSNFIRRSFQLPQSIKNQDDLWFANRLVSEALNALIHPVTGPVHINLPFSEPLYGVNLPSVSASKDIIIAETNAALSEQGINTMLGQWKAAQKKLVVVGQLPPNDTFAKLMRQLSSDPSVAILTEATSNLPGPHFIAWIDRCLAAMTRNDQSYRPDLLISLGGTVVSKRIKAWLRESNPDAHWHIDPDALAMDTYKQLTLSVPLLPEDFLRQLLPLIPKGEGEYREIWKQLSEKARESHNKFLQSCPYSDLKIFDKILEAIPPQYNVHFGNSTPIRYAQLFDYPHPFRIDANRGLSGIDGSISTAVGAAFISQKPTLVVTGDLGFFYDSNALWNHIMPLGLRIIVIHNGGGGIFRFLDGPSKTGLLEEFFEASHNTSAKFIAKAFGMDFFQASDEESLVRELPAFFADGSNAALLEVKSPAQTSAETLQAYFRNLTGD